MDAPAERDRRLVARYRRISIALAVLLAAAELLALVGIASEPLQAVWGPHGLGQFFAMALLGSFVLHLWCAPPRREALATMGLAIVLELARIAVQHALHWSPRWIVLSTGFGAGLASLLVLAWVSRRHVERRVLFYAALIVPAAVLLSNPLLQLTEALHPLTLDALVYAFDGSLGFQPSFVIGRLFMKLPPLARVSEVFYLATPFGFALLWAAQRRARTPIAVDVMVAFLVATGAGFVLYHAFPVAGPVYVVGSGWPRVPPAIAVMGLEPGYAQSVPRNCMPSLHTTWVLLMVWHSRGRGRAVRAIASLFCAFTLLATLGEGLHYLTDLVVAVPFAMSAQAASSPRSKTRSWVLLAGIVQVIAWLALLRSGLLVHSPSAPLSWTLIALTVVGSLLLERRLYFASLHAIAVAEPVPLAKRAYVSTAPSWLAAGLGAALALLIAPATVHVYLPSALIVFALGALVADQVAQANAAAIGAAVVALVCIAAPWVPSAPYLALAAGAVALVSLSRRAPLSSLSIAVFAGAAFTTLAADVLVPSLGLMRADWLAAAIALVVVVAGLRTQEDEPTARDDDGDGARWQDVAAVAAAALAFVAAYRPMLAFVVGDSVYALAAARVATFAGLSLGALAARRARAEGAAAATVRLFSLAALAACILAGALGWRSLAHYFASFGGYSSTRLFTEREVVRLGAALTALLPPAACAGAALATLLDGTHARAARSSALAAAIGAVATVFVAATIPALGPWHTLQLAAAIATVAAMIAVSAVGPAARDRVTLSIALSPFVAALLFALLAPASLASANIAAGSAAYFELPACAGTVADDADPASIATLASGGEEARPRLCENGLPLFDAAAPGAALASAAERAFVVGAPPPSRFAAVDVMTPRPAVARLLARAHAEWQPRAADLRAALDAAAGRYDLIAVARAAPLAPADAALFARDFHAAAARALDDHGLFAESLPLTRTSPRDVATILTSARAAFKNVQLRLPAEELAPALLLGCAHACPPAGGQFLDGDAIDRYRADVALRARATLDDLAAGDDAESLAWTLPRAAARQPRQSWHLNIELLAAFAAQ